MIERKFLGWFCLCLAIYTCSFNQLGVESAAVRYRRVLQSNNEKFAELLHQQLVEKKQPMQMEESRGIRLERSVEYRPVEGPMNIEQLPALLASRIVQHYPYSQKDDPAVIGR